MLESDLADVSLRELLSCLLSSVGSAERKAYLERIASDKPNGFYDRSLQMGAMPVDIRVPRTRSGDFRPATLPAPYQRGYRDETQALLLSLLTSGKGMSGNLSWTATTFRADEFRRVGFVMKSRNQNESRQSRFDGWVLSDMAILRQLRYFKLSGS